MNSLKIKYYKYLLIAVIGFLIWLFFNITSTILAIIFFSWLLLNFEPKFLMQAALILFIFVMILTINHNDSYAQIIGSFVFYLMLMFLILQFKKLVSTKRIGIIRKFEHNAPKVSTKIR